MAKLEKLPEKHIIDLFKGKVDFYHWKGMPCARRWPRYHTRTPTYIEKQAQDRFRHINQLLPLVAPAVISAYRALPGTKFLTYHDWAVRSYLSGIRYDPLMWPYDWTPKTDPPVQVTDWSVTRLNGNARIDWKTDYPCYSTLYGSHTSPDYYMISKLRRGVYRLADFRIHHRCYFGWHDYSVQPSNDHYITPALAVLPQIRFHFFVYYFQPWGDWGPDVFSRSTSPVFFAELP